MVLSKDLKIAICFGLIMGAILSLCNLCFASEAVDFDYVSNFGILPSGDTGTIIETSGGGLYYVEIEPGYTYTLTNDLNVSLNCGFFDDIAPGTSVDVFSVAANEVKTFSANDVNYLYVGRSTSGTLGISLTREALPGMSGFIDNIAYSLSIGELSSVWVVVVPILAISVLLGLGFYLLKRLLNRIKRAKGGV